MKINHITVLVSDKAVAEHFYTQILGFKKVAVGNSLWVKVGDSFLHISNSSGQPVAGTFYHFAIEVEDFKQRFTNLRAGGVKVLAFDSDNQLTEIDTCDGKGNYFVKDPDGNLIEFIEEGDRFFNNK